MERRRLRHYRYSDLWLWLEEGFAAEQLPTEFMIVAVPRISGQKEDIYACDTAGGKWRSRVSLRAHIETGRIAKPSIKNKIPLAC